MLHTVGDARARILHRLGEAARPLSLAALLPDAEPADERPNRLVREGSRWTSTLIAGLELAKQQLIRLEQEPTFIEMPALVLVEGDARRGSDDDEKTPGALLPDWSKSPSVG